VKAPPTDAELIEWLREHAASNRAWSARKLNAEEIEAIQTDNADMPEHAARRIEKLTR
jgi:hypothetical protein